MKLSQTIFEIYERIMERKALFFGMFFAVMLFSYGFLFAIDFIPEPIEEETEVGSEQNQVASNTKENLEDSDIEEEVAYPLPVSIHFDSLDRTVEVRNPISRSIEDLDAELLKGVVRHPDSADFEDSGNIFILGHSSYLPNVFNKNFQAFNGIQDLTWGDTIRLQSKDMEYVYRVERVYEAKASEVIVPNSRGDAKLTLATCNTFGSKEDRFVVEAILVSSESLSESLTHNY